MPPCCQAITADELRPDVQAARDPDSCYPHSRDESSPDNPSRDQCGMTALLVQDVLGRDLVLAEVDVDGVKIGHHYWNRLPDGTDVDITADLFRPKEALVGGAVVVEPPDAPRRHREQYELLPRRVVDALEVDGRPQPST